ncbi:MAG TPA: NADPH:quinone oxidoreductase family protein [Burkholderiales bacterium]|nr:NADPH:quinone oxidoreductase family protein [Burkholderiales bacterium]
MKAIVCKQYGPPESLSFDELPALQAGPGEVVISVKAASLNFPDVLIIENKYQFKPPLPFSPGSELAGVVKAVGEGVGRWKPGDRVMAFTTYGAFAEEAKTEAARLVAMPQSMSFDTAAAFVLAYGTSDHALRDRAGLRPGETLLVLGAAGGVGLAAVEIGKALGARVIACASSEEKLGICREHGADALVNYAKDDLRERIRALTDGRGADVIYDAVGGPYSEPAFRSIAWRGRHLIVGFAAGDIPRLPLNLALLKGASVVGVFWGDFARREPEALGKSLQQLARWHDEGKLRPHISRTFALAEAPAALRLMADRGVAGKVVLRV